MRATSGPWALELGACGGAAVERTLELPPGETVVDIDVRVPPGLVGRVVDASGEPLMGARVRLRTTAVDVGVLGRRTGPVTSSSPETFAPEVTVTTSVDGDWILPLVAADGLYVLDITLPGWQPVHLGPLGVGPAGLRRLPNVVLRRGRSIVGRIVVETGIAVPRCEVKLHGDGSAVLSTITDASGRFAFDGLARGPLRLWTEVPDAVNAGLTVDDPGDVEVTLILRHGAWIEGTLTHVDGTPATGVMVWGFPEATRDDSRVGERLARPRQAASGTDGAFRLGPFAPGPVRLTEPLQSGLEQIVDCPAGGAPRKSRARGAQVPLSASPIPGSSAWRVRASTGADGRALFVRQHDGPLAWQVTAPGYLPEFGQLDVLPPRSPKVVGKEATADLLVTLRPVAASDG